MWFTAGQQDQVVVTLLGRGGRSDQGAAPPVGGDVAAEAAQQPTGMRVCYDLNYVLPRVCMLKL